MNRTQVAAAIGVNVVTVVTGVGAVHDAVTTARGHAGIAAGIPVVQILIITVFTGIDDAVAAVLHAGCCCCGGIGAGAFAATGNQSTGREEGIAASDALAVTVILLIADPSRGVAAECCRGHHAIGGTGVIGAAACFGNVTGPCRDAAFGG